VNVNEYDYAITPAKPLQAGTDRDVRATVCGSQANYPLPGLPDAYLPLITQGMSASGPAGVTDTFTSEGALTEI
jgi:hypothetical protein